MDIQTMANISMVLIGMALISIPLIGSYNILTEK